MAEQQLMQEISVQLVGTGNLAKQDCVKRKTHNLKQEMILNKKIRITII